MDFTGPAFRQAAPPPARDTLNTSQKERDERLARALGFDDPNLDPVHVMTEDEVRNRGQRSAGRGVATASVTAASTALALEAPTAKGRTSSVQKELAAPPSEAEKARLAQVFVRVGDEAEKPEQTKKCSDARTVHRDEVKDGEANGFGKKVARFFGARNRNK